MLGDSLFGKGSCLACRVCWFAAREAILACRQAVKRVGKGSDFLLSGVLVCRLTFFGLAREASVACFGICFWAVPLSIINWLTS